VCDSAARRIWRTRKSSNAVLSSASGSPVRAASRLLRNALLLFALTGSIAAGRHAFARQGVTGFRLPNHDHTLCTGCTLVYNPALMFILSANQGQDMGSAELLTGKEMAADGSAEVTFLLGDCCVAHNQKNDRIKRRVEIAGCPPRVADTAEALIQNGIPARPEAFARFMARMVERYGEDPAFEMAHFRPIDP